MTTSAALKTEGELTNGASPRARPAPSAGPDELPPGPRIPHIAQSAGWLFFPIPFIEGCQRRYGNTFTMRFAGLPPIVVLADPAAVKEVFTGDPEIFHAGQANSILKPILGASSLLLLDGPRHTAERRLMMPSFHGERMQAYGKVMRERADAAIDRWPIGRTFPLHPEMQQVTLDVILRTVFGLAEGRREAELRRALKGMLAFGEHSSLLLLIGKNGEIRFKSVLERLGRFSPWSTFGRTIDEVNSELLEEIRHRRAAGGTHTDVLSLLLAARDEQGGSLSDEQLVDEMKTLLLAGHETTATGLTWTMLELIQHPEIWARLRDELPKGDEYLDAVIRETLRLHPIVPMVGRHLQAPARVGGREYPKGTVLAPSIYLTQRNPAAWANPERFDPGRFLGGKTSPYEFFPFGGGVRRCIGMAFALFEMRIVLRQLATRVRLRLAPGYRPRLVRRGSPSPWRRACRSCGRLDHMDGAPRAAISSRP